MKTKRVKINYTELEKKDKVFFWIRQALLLLLLAVFGICIICVMCMGFGLFDNDTSDTSSDFYASSSTQISDTSSISSTSKLNVNDVSNDVSLSYFGEGCYFAYYIYVDDVLITPYTSPSFSSYFGVTYGADTFTVRTSGLYSLYLELMSTSSRLVFSLSFSSSLNFVSASFSDSSFDFSYTFVSTYKLSFIYSDSDFTSEWLSTYYTYIYFETVPETSSYDFTITQTGAPTSFSINDITLTIDGTATTYSDVVSSGGVYDEGSVIVISNTYFKNYWDQYYIIMSYRWDSDYDTENFDLDTSNSSTNWTSFTLTDTLYVEFVFVMRPYVVAYNIVNAPSDFPEYSLTSTYYNYYVSNYYISVYYDLSSLTDTYITGSEPRFYFGFDYTLPTGYDVEITASYVINNEEGADLTLISAGSAYDYYYYFVPVAYDIEIDIVFTSHLITSTRLYSTVEVDFNSINYTSVSSLSLSGFSFTLIPSDLIFNSNNTIDILYRISNYTLTDSTDDLGLILDTFTLNANGSRSYVLFYFYTEDGDSHLFTLPLDTDFSNYAFLTSASSSDNFFAVISGGYFNLHIGSSDRLDTYTFPSSLSVFSISSSSLNSSSSWATVTGSDAFLAGYSFGQTSSFTPVFDYAYNIGSSAQWSDPITTVLYAVGDIFNIKLIGDFSLGSFLAIGLYIMFGIIIIRLFAGG